MGYNFGFLSSIRIRVLRFISHIFTISIFLNNIFILLEGTCRGGPFPISRMGCPNTTLLDDLIYTRNTLLLLIILSYTLRCSPIQI